MTSYHFPKRRRLPEQCICSSAPLPLAFEASACARGSTMNTWSFFPVCHQLESFETFYSQRQPENMISIACESYAEIHIYVRMNSISRLYPCLNARYITKRFRMLRARFNFHNLFTVVETLFVKNSCAIFDLVKRPEWRNAIPRFRTTAVSFAIIFCTSLASVRLTLKLCLCAHLLLRSGTIC